MAPAAYRRKVGRFVVPGRRRGIVVVAAAAAAAVSLGKLLAAASPSLATYLFS